MYAQSLSTGAILMVGYWAWILQWKSVCLQMQQQIWWIDEFHQSWWEWLYCYYLLVEVATRERMIHFVTYVSWHDKFSFFPKLKINQDLVSRGSQSFVEKHRHCRTIQMHEPLVTSIWPCTMESRMQSCNLWFLSIYWIFLPEMCILSFTLHVRWLCFAAWAINSSFLIVLFAYLLFFKSSLTFYYEYVFIHMFTRRCTSLSNFVLSY